MASGRPIAFIASATALLFSTRVVSRATIASAEAGPRHPAPETVRQTARQILLGDSYQHDESGWFRLDLSWLWEWLSLPFKALGNMFEGMSPVVAWVILIVMVLTLFALLGHIVYSFYLAMRVGEDFSFIEQEEPLDPSALIDDAERLAREANFVDASRRLYRAALIMLENRREGRIREGLTNREYLETFQSGWVVDNLKTFVDLIDWKWYRDRSFSADDYQSCRYAFRNIRARLEATA
jgi:hypothetical protein